MNVQESVLKFRGCQTVEELAAAVIKAKSAANKIEDPGVRFSVHERIGLVASCEVVRLLPEPTSEPIAIGPGDPDPPPPPPTKAYGEWTGALVFERLAPQGLTNPVGYQACTPEEKAELDKIARAINRNQPLFDAPTKALPSEEQRRKDYDAWWATQDVPQAWKKQGPAFGLKAWEQSFALYRAADIGPGDPEPPPPPPDRQ